MQRIRNGAATLLLAAVLAACGGGGGVPAGEDLASVSAARPGTPPQGNTQGAGTDRQACSFEHVWITVERIRVIGEAGANDITLPTPRRIDLMALPGGVLDALGVAPLAPGHYSALQLVLSPNGRPGAADSLANAVQTTGASPLPLATPSATQSGIKVPLDGDIPPGQSADVTLAFDPCSSVVEAGNSGRFNLKPILSGVLRMSGFLGLPSQLVNGTTAGDQFDPHVAALADGSYAILWTQGSVSSGFATHGQKFDALGRRVGPELLLFEGAMGDGITGLRDGGFAAVVTTSGGSVPTVLALRLDNALAPIAPAQVVVVGGEPSRPVTAGGSDIDALPDGGFLVTAHVADPRPPGVVDHFVRRFDASGQPVRDPLPLPLDLAGSPLGLPASTSVLANGSWVSAWDELFCRFGPCSNVQTFAALFNGSDAQLASFNINPNPAADEMSPSTAALQNGGYVLAWAVRPFPAAPTPEVQFQLFDQNGGAVSPVINVETPEIIPFGGMQLTALKSGGFLLSVARAPQAGEDPSTVTVLGQHFDATGQASGPLFTLGSARTPSGSSTWSVAALPSGGFVFASELPSAGSGLDIFQRLFVPAGF